MSTQTPDTAKDNFMSIMEELMTSVAATTKDPKKKAIILAKLSLVTKASLMLEDWTKEQRGGELNKADLCHILCSIFGHTAASTFSEAFQTEKMPKQVLKELSNLAAKTFQEQFDAVIEVAIAMPANKTGPESSVGPPKL